MIEVHFYNSGGGTLDVEKELKIKPDADDFLTQKISGLEYEMTDHDGDMDDNVLYYFSSNDEKTAAAEIKKLISSQLPTSSEMRFSVRIKTAAEILGVKADAGVSVDILPPGWNDKGAIFICPKCGKQFIKTSLHCPWYDTVVFDE